MNGRILIVEDDGLCARATARAVARLASARIAATASEAVCALGEEQFDALIVDIDLGFNAWEAGLEVLEFARAVGLRTPALVLTGQLTPALVNRAQALGATYRCKPFEQKAVLGFIADAVALRTRFANGDRISLIARERALTGAEEEILRLALAGRSRAEILIARGVSINTHRTQARSLLRKLGAANLKDAANAILVDRVNALEAGEGEDEDGEDEDGEEGDGE